MSKRVLWVVEFFVNDEWRFHTTYETRRAARHVAKLVSAESFCRTRVVRYDPA